MKSRKLTFIIEKTRTGFSAYEEGSAIFTTGKSISLLLANIEEALALHFENVSHFQPDYELKFEHFFMYYGILNGKLLAERIGMNASLLSQYIRGTKAMSSDQLVRIENGIRQIGKELAGMKFS